MTKNVEAKGMEATKILINTDVLIDYINIAKQDTRSLKYFIESNWNFSNIISSVTCIEIIKGAKTKKNLVH